MEAGVWTGSKIKVKEAANNQEKFDQLEWLKIIDRDLDFKNPKKSENPRGNPKKNWEKYKIMNFQKMIQKVFFFVILLLVVTKHHLVAQKVQKHVLGFENHQEGWGREK